MDFSSFSVFTLLLWLQMQQWRIVKKHEIVRILINFILFFDLYIIVNIWQTMILNYMSRFQNLIHNPKSESLRLWI